MFEKTLTDVVKGIRASRRDTSLYISQCIAEIKTEINSSDMFVKANALQKLTFLQMMGYGMSWASFASIELMSSSRFAHKRIAYLAASQGFNQDTDVILLTTNLLKKELRGGVYEAGLAINCISNIVTEDLAKDLLPELTSLTSHPQPYLRKKALLCLFKVFVKYPQGLRLTFAKIQQSLDDTNASVVSCAVNVITELSVHNPKNYLPLAPSFFQLLTTSSNNWMLIKVVKLLGSLVPEEPRLARKLLEPLADIVRNTKAKSLLYEAVHTITLCLPYCRRSDGSMPANVPEIVSLCAETLQSFVKEADQNLKYLGLVGFASLMQSHPRVLSAPGYRPIILACLSDQDVTIRSRALSLLPGMASRKNLIELVSQLLKHVELASGSYKLDLVAKIVEICSSDKYALLQDFEWYLDVLFQLGHMRGLDTHATLLRSQISDVALRVLPVRPFAVRRSIEILLEGDGKCSEDPVGDNGRGRHTMPEILPGVAWIVGEYSDLIGDVSVLPNEKGGKLFHNTASKGTYHSIIQATTSTSNFQKLPASTQEVYLQAAVKVLAAATADAKVSNEELEAACETIAQNIPLYSQSNHVEVQERAFTIQLLLECLGLFGSQKGMSALSSVCSEEKSDDYGDLLGMESGGMTTKPSKVMPTGVVSSQKLASACRQASSSLNFVLKPSPMKPVSAKAARKKNQSPLGIDSASADSIDTSAFSILVDDPLIAPISLDSVSFTTQEFPRTSPMSAGSAGPLAESSLISNGSTVMSDVEAISGLHQGSVDRNDALARQNQADPFYLDSSPKAKEDEARNAGQFGMIQLTDSDDQASDSAGKKKRKKKKKSRKQKNTAASEASLTSHVVYDSDDDVLAYSAGPASNPQSKRSGKEFESLARVDLTQPLREDEVMPERKHRVVSDPPRNTPEHQAQIQGKKTKKEKKKKSKKKIKEGAEVPNGDVGDLLELGGFGHPASGKAEDLSNAFAPPSAPQSQTSAVNSAFDDLLGLGLQSATPAPTLQSTTMAFQGFDRQLNNKYVEQPWITASLKAKSTGFDISKLSVRFKIVRTAQLAGSSVSLAFRVVNFSGSVLTGATISIKGQKSLLLGDIMPGAESESSAMGPLDCPASNLNYDLKGKLSLSGSVISVKLPIPVSVHLRPLEGMSLDTISEELSSTTLDSRSIKLKLSPNMSMDRVKAILLNFLGAAAVDDGCAESATAFAAQSSLGDKVLLLVKVKPETVKIDLKCSNPDLGKTLASDLKRLEL